MMERDSVQALDVKAMISEQSNYVKIRYVLISSGIGSRPIGSHARCVYFRHSLHGINLMWNCMYENTRKYVLVFL